jgi:hypothetical protein
VDPTAKNEREANVGLYSADKGELPVLLTNYYERIVPAAHGIGTYPFPVWVRFVWVNDTRCIYAEIMPSRPAAMLSYNQNDKRNCPVIRARNDAWQDAMNNLASA